MGCPGGRHTQPAGARSILVAGPTHTLWVTLWVTLWRGNPFPPRSSRTPTAPPNPIFYRSRKRAVRVRDRRLLLLRDVAIRAFQPDTLLVQHLRGATMTKTPTTKPERYRIHTNGFVAPDWMDMATDVEFNRFCLTPA